MTISTTSVSLSAVKAEFGLFGASTANNLLAYQRSATTSSGFYVGPTPYTTPISTSGPLSLFSFRGTSNNASTPWATTATSTGTGTITIPPETKTIVIEVWGAGGAGGRSRLVAPAGSGGGGGGAGAYAVYTATIPTPYYNYWGQTFSYTVGTGGSNGPTPSSGTTSSVSLGTYISFIKLNAGGGGFGANGGTCCAAGGSGGTVSGGPACSTGTVGGTGGCGAPGLAGAAGVSSPALSPTVAFGGAGAPSSPVGGFGGIGQNGAVRFTWK
jgi:hypothetical protein